MNMTKRKNGEGSWGTKVIKGVSYNYYRKYYEETNEDKYFYGKTQKEVEQKRKEYEANIPDYVKIDKKNIPKVAFEDLCKYWITKVKPFDGSSTREITLNSYESIIDTRIYNTTLGHTQIGSFTKQSLEEYRDYLAYDKKLSRASIKRTYCVLNQFCDYLVEKKYIPINYAKEIKLPSENAVLTKKRDVKFLQEDDMNKLYQEHMKVDSDGKRIYNNNSYVVVFILYTGLRISECLALKWRDIDFDHKIISVTHTLSKVKRNNISYIVDNQHAKSDKGIRNIPITDRAFKVLDEIKKKYPNKSLDDYIFIDEKEQFLNQRNITKTLEKMLNNSGCSVKKCGLHALRHSFGSYLILHGTDVKTVSELLGHSDVSTTLNIYIHIINLQKMRAIQLFNNDEIISTETKENNSLNQSSITETLEFLSDNGIQIIEIEDGMLGYLLNGKIVKVPINKTLDVAGRKIKNINIYSEFYNEES